MHTMLIAQMSQEHCSVFDDKTCAKTTEEVALASFKLKLATG